MISIFKNKSNTISFPLFLEKTVVMQRVVTDLDLAIFGIIHVNIDLGEVKGITAEDITWKLINTTTNEPFVNKGNLDMKLMMPGIYRIEFASDKIYTNNFDFVPKTKLLTLKDGGDITFDCYCVNKTQSGDGGGDEPKTGSVTIKMNTANGGWRLERIEDNGSVTFIAPTTEIYSNDTSITLDKLPFGKYRLNVKDNGMTLKSPTPSEFIQIMDDTNPVLTWNIEYESIYVDDFRFFISITPTDFSQYVKWEINDGYSKTFSGVGSQGPFLYERAGSHWYLTIDDSDKKFINKDVGVNGSILERKDNKYFIDLYFDSASDIIVNIAIADKPVITTDIIDGIYMFYLDASGQPVDFDYDDKDNFFKDLTTYIKIYDSNGREIRNYSVATLNTQGSPLRPDSDLLESYRAKIPINSRFEFSFTKSVHYELYWDRSVNPMTDVVTGDGFAVTQNDVIVDIKGGSISLSIYHP